MHFPKPYLLLLLSAVAIGFSGCAASNLLKLDRDEVVWAGPESPAVRMVTIWEPAEGRGVDGMPTRGFAGQILFIGTETRSLAVKGDVAVYVFDDVGTAEEQAKPIHRFDFSSDAWNMHRHKGSLGTTYNVFIPYTRDGNVYQTKCSLLVRLRSSDGELNSELISVTLPGPKKKPEAELALVDQDSSTVTPDGIADQIEARYRQMQAAKRSAEIAGADGAIQRRSEALGTIRNDRGRQAISEQMPSSEITSPAESAALQQKIAQLEAQLQQVQGTGRPRVRQVGHQSAQWNDPFQQFEQEQLGRRLPPPADQDRSRNQHPLSSGALSGRQTSRLGSSAGGQSSGHRSTGTRPVDAFEGFPGDPTARAASSGRLKLGATPVGSDRPPAAAAEGRQFSRNPLFDDFNNSSASSIGAARSSHPLMD